MNNDSNDISFIKELFGEGSKGRDTTELDKLREKLIKKGIIKKKVDKKDKVC